MVSQGSSSQEFSSLIQMFRAPGQIYPDSGSDRKLFSHIMRRSSRSFLIVDILNRCPRDLLVVSSVSRVQRRTLEHRSITPRSITPTVPSWEYISWRCITLSLPKKLTSLTANLEWWCHVHFIRDSFITFIRWVIGPGKNSIKLFFNTEFDFKCTWNRDWTTIFCTSIWLVSPLPGIRRNQPMCGQGILERIG